VTPERAWVEVRQDELEARFGRWLVRTPVHNVVGIEVTGPYSFLRTAGPPRLGVTDRGLTFATNGDRVTNREALNAAIAPKLRAPNTFRVRAYVR